MRYLSLFSGIEAATVAWQPLGFELCAVSEIEPFPCSVLAHRYPDVPNLGDVKKITREQIGALGRIDLVVGGFPCQDVSVAGKRAGLKNDDGSATRSGLFFDAMRIVEWIRPRWTVIENVPGLFSSNAGLDFAAVVGEMAGCEFDVPADGWRSSGVAIGPRGLVEWTVLDAQYHGLAQRRRRVFLVRDSGNWADRPPLFLESYRLQGHPAPRRETGQRHASTISARTQGGGGLGTDFDLDGGLIANTLHASDGHHAVRRDGDNLIHCPDIVPQAISSKWSNGSSGPAGDEVANLVAHALRADGFDASEDGTGRGTPLIPVAFDCKTSGQNGFGVGEIASTLRSMGHASSHQNGVGHLAVAFHENQRGEITTNDTAGTLTCNGGKPGQGYPAVAVAQSADTFYSKGINRGDIYASAQEKNAGTLLSGVQEEIGEKAFAEWGLGILFSLYPPEVLRCYLLCEKSLKPAAFSRSWVVASALESQETRGVGALRSLQEARGEGCSPQGRQSLEQLSGELGAYLSELSQPGAQATRFVRDLWQAAEGTGILRQALSEVQKVGRPAGSQGQSILRDSERWGSEGDEDVRGFRVQCKISRERVLHETHTASKTRHAGRGATEQERGGENWVGETPLAIRRLTPQDGNKYKALGNSFAVPVVRWIGKRIQHAHEISNSGSRK